MRYLKLQSVLYVFKNSFCVAFAIDMKIDVLFWKLYDTYILCKIISKIHQIVVLLVAVLNVIFC